MSATILSFAAAAYTLVAFAVTGLAFVAWHRSGSVRQMLLALSFAQFALAGVVTSAWLFLRNDTTLLLAADLGLGTLGLLTLYVAAVKR